MSRNSAVTSTEIRALALMLVENDVRTRVTSAETNKTGLTCLYLRHRSVKAVVARDTTLVVVCSRAFE